MRTPNSSSGAVFRNFRTSSLISRRRFVGRQDRPIGPPEPNQCSHHFIRDKQLVRTSTNTQCTYGERTPYCFSRSYCYHPLLILIPRRMVKSSSQISGSRILHCYNPNQTQLYGSHCWYVILRASPALQNRSRDRSFIGFNLRSVYFQQLALVPKYYF